MGVDTPGTAPPYRVVVVDDAAELRELLTLLFELEDDFLPVGAAANGAEAVEVAREQQPHLVMLDLSMPVMDGLQALPLLRTAAPAAKVVIFSGFESGSMHEQARAVGADGYIEKGTGVQELIAQVRSICLAPDEVRHSG